jgi:hypothetical protein
MRPTFATNRGSETVAEALKGHLGWLASTWAKPFELSVSTAYFNPGGFRLIADELEKVSHVRLMLGAEPDSGVPRLRSLELTDPERVEAARVRRALEGHLEDLERDRDLLGFTVEADGDARRLITWLRSDAVEVKRYEEGFLHGKCFLVATDDEGVIAGSSNLTHAGLATNLELNLGHYQPEIVGRVRAWFDELWEEANPFDLAAIYDPYLVFLKMLYERYGAELEEEAKAPVTGIELTLFGRHGVWRARRILDQYKGVLVADGVGLGKTFLAGELMRQAVEDRRQRVLLVAPASLRDGMWASFLNRYRLYVECVSYEQLSDDLQVNPARNGQHLRSKLDEYAMVVIDESHAYRNPETERAGVLRRLLSGKQPKELVLVTATPVNNSLWDLYYLLAYFIKNDAAFAKAGIRSLRSHFAQAMAQDPEDLTPDRLFDVLDAVAVRRTRRFVKRFYPHESITLADGTRMEITFPKPVVHRVNYDLERLLPGFFARLAHALDCDEPDCEDPDRRDEHPEAFGAPVLTLARYSPTRFLRDVEALKEARTERGMEVRRRLGAEAPLSGLLRSGLMKRFESSAHAFAITCRNMARSHDAFLSLLDQDWVATGEALAEWMRSDSDELDEFINGGHQLDDAADYDVPALRAAVEADRDLLVAFADEADQVTPERDPKLAALAGELGEIARQAAREGVGPNDVSNKGKVIVFTYYADTAQWIHDDLERLVASSRDLIGYRGRFTLVSGDEDNKTRAAFGFAPESTEAPLGTEDRYDLLVATDVLAEGVNLQQARHIINYDLPWNPMRLVQRLEAHQGVAPLLLPHPTARRPPQTGGAPASEDRLRRSRRWR